MSATTRKSKIPKRSARGAAPAGCVALSRYARKVVIAEVSSGEAEVATFW